MTNTKTSQTNPNKAIDPDEFREMVAERAFSKAEARSFAAGHDQEDWLEAEQEVRDQPTL
ncbi:MAG: DUF2934 domain-containing protein [Gammaproteobacteria bacterium HGW-Gammaproteobacteria-10]|nr:MAG: DUF2934 domain-containing protein [Gammaproteobacteria bacterium HGW-Gammaproteobacteria-10]